MSRKTDRRRPAIPRVSPWRGWPVLIFLAMVGAGLFRRETAEILINATLLCLSCIGLGK